MEKDKTDLVKNIERQDAFDKAKRLAFKYIGDKRRVAGFLTELKKELNFKE